MLKFRVVNLSSSFFRSSIFPSATTQQRDNLQRAIDEIGEENIRYIAATPSDGGGSPTFTIFYHEDDPA